MVVPDKKPVGFTGKLVRLRLLRKETDFERCLEWVNKPDVTQFLSVNPPVTREQEEKWFDGLPERKNDMVFAIETLAGEHIGNIGLHNIDHINCSASTGTFIGEQEFWGHGYGTDAKMLLLYYAFNVLNLHRVWSEVFDFNGRSAAYNAKCGYKEEGRMRQHIWKNGAYHDAIVMGVLREEWRPLWDTYNQRTE